MSNIPPDPPDPPISHNDLITRNTRDLNTQPSTRRGRGGRGHGRGRRRLPVSDKEVGDNTNSQSDARSGPSRRGRPGRARGTGNTSRNNSNNVPANAPSNAAILEPVAKDAVETKTDDRNSSTGRPRDRKDNSSRRGQFGAQLSRNTAQNKPIRSKSPSSDSDLTTRLIHSMKTPPYPDCPICFNPLHPAQPIWSCSLGDGVTSCCWTPFHLKCIKDWAKKSTKDVRDALQARGVTNETEYWRCPGCQTKRNNVPRGYLCFCGSMTDPKPGAATPHSCGSSCTRKRLACDHPCPLSCHPGPCPPCTLTIYVPCHCGKMTNAMRCENSRSSKETLISCGAVCGRRLQCQAHLCNQACHSGDCGKCEKVECVTCYCGQNSKEVECGSGIDSARDAHVLDAESGETHWVGRFDCGSKCKRFFDCGLHSCSKSCHVPSPTPPGCPFSPDVVTTCFCGKHSLLSIPCAPRAKCTDPIPSCQSICGKSLKGCSHNCAEICHPSSCPPCKEVISVPCRCGLTVRQMPCCEQQGGDWNQQELFLCDKVCGALRLCGRHQCSRICCPLGSIARNKANKSKKKGTNQTLNDDLEDSEKLWHTCDLVCGKALSCGSHRCTEADHRGPCPPCLLSSFEEMICHCGRTVIEPPVPCGTIMSCNYPCARPPPLCGHEKAPHQCHDDIIPCPPCPFLTTKPCACNKTHINNVRCSQETVLCGQPCGKLLDCGFHKCKRSCHGDPCGSCPSICGKPRKSCLPDSHPCTLPCHAPSACNESEPCTATITVTCPCGRLQQPTKCGKSFSNPGRTALQLQCRDECAIAKRNAKLAEALGISPDRKEKSNTIYADELVAFAKANLKFITAVENTLNEFVNSERKTQVLPYTPEGRRKFVRELCHLYRTDSQLIDPEPRRSIQIFRRIDTRIPTPLLTAFITQNTPPSLGKLADLRTVSSSTRLPPVTSYASSSSSRQGPPNATGRGWTSVVTVGQGNASNPSKPVVADQRQKLEVTLPKLGLGGSRDSPKSGVRDNWESD